MNKDVEALKKITRDGCIWVNGAGHEFRRDNDTLPITRISCRNNLCNSKDVVAIEKCFLFASRRKGIVARCHKCGRIVVVPAEVFSKVETPARPVFRKPLDLSTESIQRKMMELKGLDKEDIDAKCDFFREEWEKRDRAEKIQYENWKAENSARFADEQRKKEAVSFKEKLDAGIYAFDKTARAFYEVATGKIIRKL